MNLLPIGLVSFLLFQNLIGCRAQKNPLDTKNDYVNPITDKELLENKIGSCTARGMGWDDKNQICIASSVACAKLKDYTFDFKKNICLSPKDRCLASKVGNVWIDSSSSCMSGFKACMAKKDGSVWTGKACVSSEEACNQMGYRFLWSTQNKRCRMRGFLEYCNDLAKAPASAQETVKWVMKTAKPSGQATCQEAWSYLYYTKSIQLNKTTSNLTDFYPLSDAASLEEVTLDGLPVDDVYPLAFLPSLKRLTVKNTKKLNDISILEVSEGLTNLDLSGDNITDTQPLSNLPKLTALTLDSNQIDAIEYIGLITTLQNLSLKNNQISNIFYLKNLSNLKTLDLSNTPIGTDLKKNLSNCPRGADIALVLDRFCAQLNY